MDLIFCVHLCYSLVALIPLLWPTLASHLMELHVEKVSTFYTKCNVICYDDFL